MHSPLPVRKSLLAALCHASALFFPVLLPLIILLLSRDSHFVRSHARKPSSFIFS